MAAEWGIKSGLKSRTCWKFSPRTCDSRLSSLLISSISVPVRNNFFWESCKFPHVFAHQDLHSESLPIPTTFHLKREWEKFVWISEKNYPTRFGFFELKKKFEIYTWGLCLVIILRRTYLLFYFTFLLLSPPLYSIIKADMRNELSVEKKCQIVG